MISNNDSSITLDWEETNLIEATGIAILSSLADKAFETNCKIFHKNLPPAIAREMANHPLFKSQNEVTEAKYYFIERANSLNYCTEGGFSPYFVQMVLEKFERLLSSKIQFHLQLILNELLQNAVDHSGAERYFLFVELKDNILRFGVLDSGVGIPSKMAQKYHKPNDEEYIDYSFKEGISTRKLRSGGYGLFHTFKITKNYDGTLTVLSQKGAVRRYFSQRKVKKLKLKFPLHGTWCFVELKLGVKYE